MNILISITVFNKDISSIDLIKQFPLICKSVDNYSFGLLIFDNSFIRQNSSFLKKYPSNYVYYEWNGMNEGIRGSILHSQKILNLDNEMSWSGVLFLDQDTCTKEIMKFITKIDDDPNQISVPKIFDQHGNICSPCSINSYGFVKPDLLAPNSAIFSFSYFPLSIINNIFVPRYFWLDYLDHYLFIKNDLKISVINFCVSHNLSISDSCNLNLFRMSNIIKSEFYFLLFCRPLGLFFLPFKVIKRLMLWFF